MRERNLPTLDGRYWAAMVVASVLGTTAGDLVSNSVGLGFAGALLPLGVLFATVLVAERRTTRTSEAYYWVAVVVARMMATNLGDFIARTLGLGYGWVSFTDSVLVTVFLVATRPHAASRSGAPARKLVPTIDTRYWIALLLVSVMGTNAGDFLSSDTGLGLGGASLALGALLAAVLALELGARTGSRARYWTVIAVIRTAGTVTGDFLTNKLHLGFALGAGIAAALLAVILAVPWQDGRYHPPWLDEATEDRAIAEA